MTRQRPQGFEDLNMSASEAGPLEFTYKGWAPYVHWFQEKARDSQISVYQPPRRILDAGDLLHEV
jgi:hypothetical protein